MRSMGRGCRRGSPHDPLDVGVSVTLYDINSTLTVTVLNAASELPGLDLVNGWHSIALMADGPNSGGIMTITLLVDGQSAGTRNLPGRDVGRIGAIIVPDQFDEDRVTSMGEIGR